MPRPPAAPPHIDWPLDGWKVLVAVVLTVLLLGGALFLRSHGSATPLPAPITSALILTSQDTIQAESE